MLWSDTKRNDMNIHTMTFEEIDRYITGGFSFSTEQKSQVIDRLIELKKQQVISIEVTQLLDKTVNEFEQSISDRLDDIQSDISEFYDKFTTILNDNSN